MCLCVVFWLVSPGFAATITVESDGSGDYTEIQPALDAAADGDTVRVGVKKAGVSSVAYSGRKNSAKAGVSCERAREGLLSGKSSHRRCFLCRRRESPAWSPTVPGCCRLPRSHS